MPVWWLRGGLWVVVLWAGLIGLVRPGLWLPRDEVALAPPLSPVQQHSYTVTLPPEMSVPTAAVGLRSDLYLYEDGRRLGPFTPAPHGLARGDGPGSIT